MSGEQRVKRQSDESTTKKEESFEQELCKDKDAGEWFRLVAGEGDNCRDVIQCTSSVSGLHYEHMPETHISVEGIFIKLALCNIVLLTDLNRVCKRFVAQPVCSSTSKNKRATGRNPWKTANWRIKNVRWNHCCILTSHTVQKLEN